MDNPKRPQWRRQCTLSERSGYFVFTFVLTLGTLWFAAFTEHGAFGWREVVMGSVAGIVLGGVVAIASDWLRELVFWLFFP